MHPPQFPWYVVDRLHHPFPPKPALSLSAQSFLYVTPLNVQDSAQGLPSGTAPTPLVHQSELCFDDPTRSSDGAVDAGWAANAAEASIAAKARSTRKTSNLSLVMAELMKGRRTRGAHIDTMESVSYWGPE